MVKRIHYVDWLRVLAVLALFPFHAARVFDTTGPFYAKSATTSVILTDAVIAFLDLFHMPLLFLLAGASIYFALARRSNGVFLRERLLRLGVPFVFGALVIVPPQSWIGARTNAGYAGGLAQYWPTALTISPSGDLSGYFGHFTPAHLWFVLFLLVLSAVALRLFRWLRTERGAGVSERLAARFATPAGVAIVLVPLFVADVLPDIGGKNPFYYLAYLVAGYVFMSDPRWAELAERRRVTHLLVGLVAGVVTVLLWTWRAGVADVSLGAAGFAVLRLGAGLALVLACLGFGRRYLDRSGPALTYLAEASYPVYILHQTVIVLVGAWVLTLLPEGVWLPYLAIMIVGTAVTFGIYEIVRRAGVLRFLFGMRPRARAVTRD